MKTPDNKRVDKYKKYLKTKKKFDYDDKEYENGEVNGRKSKRKR